MNWLDVALIIVIIMVIVRGSRSGFIRQVVSLLGLVAGIIAASYLVPKITPYAVGFLSRAVLTLLIFGLMVLLFGGWFEYLGVKLAVLRHEADEPPPLDRAAGAVLGFILILVAIWLFAGAFGPGPWAGLSHEIKTSKVVRLVDDVFPPPPKSLAQVEKIISQIHAPKVFVGPEPQTSPAQSQLDPEALQKVMNQDAASVVEVTGYGCGGILEGSGFVADNDLVITNAHVVAGIRHPIVHDRNGTHTTVVEYFNPDLDIAVLRAIHLYGQPLGILSTNVNRGTTGAVLGYPGGGPYTGVGAAVADRIEAVGRNIYDQGLVRRSVYILNADVEPGNSGGPFVLPDGWVAGLVFAKSGSQANVGYALTSNQLAGALTAAKQSASAVSTGQCAV